METEVRVDASRDEAARCPICGARVRRGAEPVPFCSARCRDVDNDQELPEIATHAATDVNDVRWVPFQELPYYDVTEGLRPIIRAGIAMQSQWEQC